MRLLYRNAAGKWTEALPLGNGHLGAMVYGGAGGTFDLSENTCWSGEPPVRSIGEKAAGAMAQARALIMENRFDRADEWLAECLGTKENYGTQLPMGRFGFALPEHLTLTERSLDLETGIAADIFTENSTIFLRESFISNKDKVLCSRITAGGRPLPEITVSLDGRSNPHVLAVSPDGLRVSGKAVESLHSDGRSGTRFAIDLRIVTDGKSVPSGNTVRITGSMYCECHLAAATGMQGPDPEEAARSLAEAAVRTGWEAIARDHRTIHSEAMNRCTLHLPANSNSALPTDERIRRFRDDPSDHDLTALLFQYGRYLLYNSSMPDSLLPAALQGVWNDDRACRMEWTDDMHLDINTQLNYWSSHATGLGDCSIPLFRWLLGTLYPSGRRTAKELYGADGFAAHTVSNAYGYTAPGWGIPWGFHVSGGAWLATHVWEHYRYTNDRDFLKKHFPVLLDSLKFLASLLMDDPVTGESVIVPSYSPENMFLHNGKGHCVTKGAAIDMLILDELCDIVTRCSEILDHHDDFTGTIREIRSKTAGFRIGKHGQLQEWFDDYDEYWPDHRHMSHLLSLYPFYRITPETTPQLAAAAAKTLERRLAAGAEDILTCNWSVTLLILYYAALERGDDALTYIQAIISRLSRPNLMITHSGGIYELDGNTGFTAGTALMFLQCKNDALYIIPALPGSIRQGRFDGMVAEHGHTVSADWDLDAGRVDAELTGNLDENVTIRCLGREKMIRVRKGRTVKIRFRTE